MCEVIERFLDVKVVSFISDENFLTFYFTPISSVEAIILPVSYILKRSAPAS